MDSIKTPGQLESISSDIKTYSISKALAILQDGNFTYKYNFPANYATSMDISTKEAENALRGALLHSASVAFAQRCKDLLSDPVKIKTDESIPEFLDHRTDTYVTNLVVLSDAQAKEIYNILRAYERKYPACIAERIARPFDAEITGEPYETS